MVKQHYLRVGVMNSKLINLPFDQYSRQLIVKQLVEKLFVEKKLNEQKEVLDIGGHKGKTKEFFPNDKVSILDVFEETYEGYIKGDATQIHFPSQFFDIAVSFDVLEHIPPKKREKFILESIRVSKYGVFLAFPSNDKDNVVSESEKKINQIHNLITGVDHRWLKEHIDLGIPNIQGFEKILNRNKIYFCSIDSNRIDHWILLQTAVVLAQKNPSVIKYIEKLNKVYNQNITKIDTKFQGKYYRKIYYISEIKSDVDFIEKIIASSVEFDSHNNTDILISSLIADLMVGLEVQIQELEAKNNELRNDLDIANKNLLSIMNTLSWKITKPLRLIKSRITKL